MLERSTALIRKATGLTAGSFVVLVGAAAAWATGARSIAIALLVVGGLGLITSFFVVVSAYSRSKGEQAVLVRDALAEQRRMGGSVPPPGRGAGPDARK